MKNKIKIRRIIQNIKLYLALPHIIIFIIIFILTIITFILSMLTKDNNISSILLNIFAGLITGIVISALSVVKSVSLYRITSKVKWLEELNKEILSYYKLKNELKIKSVYNKIPLDMRFDKIYDLICSINNIAIFIEQNQYNKKLTFNSEKYIKKDYNFDLDCFKKESAKVRDIILDNEVEIENGEFTSKDLLELINDLDKLINTLNTQVLSKKRELEIKIKAINIT